MNAAVDEELYRRAAALLEPGDVELHGAVIHTRFDPDEESLLHQATLDAGDAVADARSAETFVYSGNDDEQFGVNQHQGRTVSDEEFVWECQQLLREGTYDVVLYWEAADDFEAILDDLHDVDGVERVVGVTADGVVDD